MSRTTQVLFVILLLTLASSVQAQKPVTCGIVGVDGPDRVKPGMREIDPIRLVTVDCGFAPELTAKLYVVPAGATLPVCDESAQIPYSEVKFTKPRPKTSKKQR